MVSLKIEVRKKDVTWVVLLVAVLVVGVVYAYGTSNPSVMGHSWGEVECNDCIEASNIAVNAVGDSEMIDNPSFSSVTLGGVSKSSWPSGGGCLDGYDLFELGNSYVCLKDGSQITSFCVKEGGVQEAHTWARNNGGVMQTKASVYIYGGPRCDSGWVNGVAQCTNSWVTAHATASSGGLQSKLMSENGVNLYCTGFTSW